MGSIVVSGALAGLLLHPRRTLRAWRAGRAARPLWTTLGKDAEAYEALLALDVRELRAKLGVSEGGVADVPRGLHKNAPGALAASSV